MKYEFERSLPFSYHYGDGQGLLSISSAFDLNQDMITVFFSTFNSDNMTLRRENRALWVFSKVKIKMYDYPHWEERLVLNSHFVDIKPVRVTSETKCYRGEDLIFTSLTEECPIDLDTRMIRKLSSVIFPSDAEAGDKCDELSFTNLNNIVFEESDLVKKVEVQYTETDLSAHTNNVSYVRYCVNTFPRNFYDHNSVVEMEIHFKRESHYGETLEIYRKINDNRVDFLIKKGDEEIVRSYFTYKAK